MEFGVERVVETVGVGYYGVTLMGGEGGCKQHLKYVFHMSTYVCTYTYASMCGYGNT